MSLCFDAVRFLQKIKPLLKIIFSMGLTYLCDNNRVNFNMFIALNMVMGEVFKYFTHYLTCKTSTHKIK